MINFVLKLTSLYTLSKHRNIMHYKINLSHNNHSSFFLIMWTIIASYHIYMTCAYQWCNINSTHLHHHPFFYLLRMSCLALVIYQFCDLASSCCLTYRLPSHCMIYACLLFLLRSKVLPVLTFPSNVFYQFSIIFLNHICFVMKCTNQTNLYIHTRI